MIVRVLGIDLLNLLMSVDRNATETDMSWLLYGPTDDLVVEQEFADDEDVAPLRWAAE